MSVESKRYWIYQKEDYRVASFNIGETVICWQNVKKDNGEYIDPATSMEIEIIQIKPHRQIVISVTAMTKDDVGKYHYDFQSDGASIGGYEAKYIATDGTRITIQKQSFVLE